MTRIAPWLLLFLCSACANPREPGSLGDPGVRVSQTSNAKALSFLFGPYKTLEVGDRSLSGCNWSEIIVSGLDTRDAVTNRPVQVDEIKIQSGNSSRGPCTESKILVVRGFGAWSKGLNGDHYEFAGTLRVNGTLTPIRTAFDLAQVGGPHLLRLKTAEGSFLLSRISY